MKQLPYIEDYILLMATDMLSWPPSDPLINLARYDVPIVNSMAEQINRGLGFSDKQAILAHKIVCKYKRQWNLVGYDVSQQEINGLFKLPIRTIDRSTTIDIDDDKIFIRFPYNQDLISKIRAKSLDIPGTCVFDKDRRCWVASLIEPRIVWAYNFGIDNNFELSEKFLTIYQSILNHPKYEIILKPKKESFEIENAPHSLIEYIEKNGGFEINNLLKLIDMAGILGFSVHESTYQYLDADIDIETLSLLTQRETNIKYDIGGEIDISQIVNYAKMTNRFPIYVYETNSTQLKSQIDKYFTSSEITDRKKNPPSQVKGKVVYFNHWKLADLEIPLLITTHVLMIGNRRQQMLQCADKIVFFSQRVDNDKMPVTNS